MIDEKAAIGKATKTEGNRNTNDSDKPASRVARNNETYGLC